MAYILAIDDEMGILNVIKHALKTQGHEVSILSKPADLDKQKLYRYDLILLDVMMPDIDGFELCDDIRHLVDCPIIFLTAKNMEKDIVYGLGLGADDYITKPFNIVELRARVNAHLRREKREKQNSFMMSDLKFVISSNEIYYNDTLVPFTKSEYKICELLALNHGQTFSKDRIIEKIFGYESNSNESAIVEHIKNIRAKLKRLDKNNIETVWGIGYKWRV